MLCAVLCTVCLMLGCAGCVQPSVTPENYTLEAPEDMVLVLDRYADVVVSGFTELEVDSRVLADDIGRVSGNDSEIVDLLLKYYAEKPWMALLAYYPENSTEGMFVPAAFSHLRAAITHHHNESDFTGSHTLWTRPFYISEYGYVAEVSLPVYSPDGTYRGYVSFFFDSGMLFHTFAEGVPELSEYAISVVLPDGWVLYCTATEYIGWDISGGSLDFVIDHEVDYNTLVVLPEGVIKYPAYTPLYLGKYEKINVWKTVTVNLFGTDVRLMVNRPVSPWSVPADVQFTPDAGEMTKETLEAFQYARSHSKEKTLEYIRNKVSTYPLVAYDMEGNVLAMSSGTQRSSITSWINLHDAYDVSTVRHMIYLAQQGGGYLQKYESASVGEIPTDALLLLIYVMPVDDSWFITIRMPAESEVSPMIPHAVSTVTTLVRNTTLYAWEYGKEAILADINSGSSKLLAAASGNITDFAAIDMQGIVLANAFVPGDVGKNIFSFTDANGASFGRQYVLSVMDGGGLTYNVLPIPNDPTQQSVRLIYLEAVDDKWFVLAGTELDITSRADPQELMP